MDFYEALEQVQRPPQSRHQPPRCLPLSGATATGYRRDELQTGDHMHTDGFGGKSAGQKGGTSPEDGPNGHRTLACVTTWMETCHRYRETSHHTVDETASVYSYFSLRYRNTLSTGESREETNPTFTYNNAPSRSPHFFIESCG